MTDLPLQFPLFPLTGVLLLPRGTLPLQAFEPRYLAMVDEALRRDRIIGIVQPDQAADDPIPNDTPLKTVGCAGRIIAFEETENGRYRLHLRGLSRFTLHDTHDHPNGFRVGDVSYRGFEADNTQAEDTLSDRCDLEVAIRHYCDAQDIETDWDAIEGSTDETLVTSFSMLCPLDPQEKQALLECATLEQRSTMLTALLEVSSHGPSDAIRH